MQQGQFDEIDVISFVQEIWKRLLTMEICKRRLSHCNSEAKRQLHRYRKKVLISVSIWQNTTGKMHEEFPSWDWGETRLPSLLKECEGTNLG